MLLSIIIPCYNCSKTIEALLMSILINELNKNDYEIIICDDKSTDNFMDKVEKFKAKMNITYCTTTRDVHCPGNTRQAALPYIKGDYFTFIDHDDEYEPDSLNIIVEVLKLKKPEFTLVTNLREYFPETNTYGRTYEGIRADTWLHGKFFNTENTLNKIKCHFKEDMMSHEDLYWNSYNLTRILYCGGDYMFAPLYSYKWVYNPNSLSRSYYNEKYFYIDQYLTDYITGAIEPFFEIFAHDDITEDLSKFCKDNMKYTLLHAYYYYQACIYRNGEDFNEEIISKNYNEIKSLTNKILDTLNIDIDNLISMCYEDATRWTHIREECINGAGDFCELQSLKDFLLNL